jgi:hypothetical protein
LIGRFANVHVQGNIAQQIQLHVARNTTRAVMAENVRLMLALWTMEKRHVLNHAQYLTTSATATQKYRNVDFAKHVDSLFSVKQCDILRRRDNHGAVQYHGLRYCELRITCARH